MIDSETKELLLRNYAELRDLPAAKFDGLCANANLMRTPKGTVMFDEDQRCQGIPGLLSGSVRAVRAAPNGRELYGAERIARVDVDFFAGPKPTGTFHKPSRALRIDKQNFGARR